MKFFTVFCLLCLFGLAYSRYVDEELIATNWMDRINIDLDPRIFRGEPAEISDFPYMLAYIDLSLGGFRCGSSAIGRQWALTAAHCFRDSPANMLQLRGGSTNRNSGGILFQVDNYWTHPGWNTRHEYDIGIIRTQNSSPIEGTNVAFVALPQICPDDRVCCNVCANVNVVVSGWGQTETGSTHTLRQLTKPVHEWNDCMRIWSRDGPSFFCTQVIDGRDVCGGDSGSPLVTGTGVNRVQQGVVSFGHTVCGDRFPSVMIRIEHGPVRNWITSHSGI